MRRDASRGRMLALLAVGLVAILPTSSAHALNRSAAGFGPEQDTVRFDAGQDDSHPAWSPDGRRIAYLTRNADRYDINVMNADGRDKRRLSANAAPEASLAWSPNGKGILFEGARDGTSGFFVVNAEGSKERRLTSGEADDHDPSWSPDGRSIVFVSKPRAKDSPGKSGIYVMAADGTNRRRVTPPSNGDTSPAFSPDGKRIAFVRARPGARVVGGSVSRAADIHVIDVDGGTERQVTHGSGIHGDPVWSPDGRTIAFVSGYDGPGHFCGCNIAAVDADGANQRLLTEYDYADRVQPAWSPDSRTIVFVWLGESFVARINADGSGERRLTQIPLSVQLDPVWSPRGDKIAFVVDRSPDTSNRAGDIYVIDPEGGHTLALTQSWARDAMPAWSPDGRKIAFSSNRHGSFDIYVVDANGGNLRQLTRGGTYDYFAPAWSPDGTRIAFGKEDRGSPISVAGPVGIMVVDADGSNPKRLTQFSGRRSGPAWSPDGKTIAFAGERGAHGIGINLVDVDSGVERPLTPAALGGRFPSWSPDGRSIVFATDPRGAPQSSGANTVGDQIYAIDVNGRHLRRLTRAPTTDSVPAWSPDGNRVVFQSTRHAPGQKAYANLWLMNADGTALRRLTDGPATDSNPTWSPDGSKITFDSTKDGSLVIHVMNADGSGRHLLTRRALVA